MKITSKCPHCKATCEQELPSEYLIKGASWDVFPTNVLDTSESSLATGIIKRTCEKAECQKASQYKGPRFIWVRPPRGVSNP